MQTSTSSAAGPEWESDHWLIIWIVVLWSTGRTLNPILRAFDLASAQPGPLLTGATVVYMTLHLCVLVYALILLGRLFGRAKLRLSGAVLGEFFLYLYVVITVLLSLYFLVYQLGYLPPSLENFLPYPFNLS